jgi:hypothetical protein
MKCDGGSVFVYFSKSMQSVSRNCGSLTSYLSRSNGIILVFSPSVQKGTEIAS